VKVGVPINAKLTLTPPVPIDEKRAYAVAQGLIDYRRQTDYD
jgi:hypothetical protein